MRRFLFVAAFATLLAAGCQKTEIINQVNPDGTPMTFSTGIAKLTKADGAALDATLKTQGFKLTAIRAYDDKYTSDIEFNAVYYGMENLEFKHENDKWNLVNGQTYFWPGTGKDLVFLAMSSSNATYAIPTVSSDGLYIGGTPVMDDNKPTGAYSDVTVDGFTFPYETPALSYSDEGIQTGADDDLMISDVVIQNQGDTDGVTAKGKVDLVFKHVLSKVEFAFTTSATTVDDYPVTVTELLISDVVTKGNLEVIVDFNGNRTSANEYDWSPNDDKTLIAPLAESTKGTDFNVKYNLPVTSVDKAAPNNYATWLVIPQDITGKMVTIKYQIVDKITKDTKTFESVWPLTTETLKEWGRNKYVRYNVNLSPNIIEFNPTVEDDWEVQDDVESNN